MHLDKVVIKKGLLTQAYQDLVGSLYQAYPAVIKAKQGEFSRAFSASNPFFRYGQAENFFLFNEDKVVGHISAILDERSGEFGYVGFFECENNQEYAVSLFTAAQNFLRAGGKKKCRGPINFSTWQGFRVSYPEEHAPFFLEPFTREYYRDLFKAQGFAISHENITTREHIGQTALANYLEKYTDSLDKGYSYEFLSNETREASLHDIYELSGQIFNNSFSFYNISEEEFLYLASSYGEQPGQIILVLRQQGKAIGFFLVAVDLFNPAEKRLVLKTMGLLEEYRGKGLGPAMFYAIYLRAKDEGCQELIFSTMDVKNKKIRSITGEAEIYRHYEVFDKNIL